MTHWQYRRRPPRKQGGQGVLALQPRKKPLWVLGAREALVLGPDLPAARHSLGLARHGARTASPSFPCNCRFGREHLLCNISVFWLCALSNVAVPAEGEVGEGQIEMVTSSSMG